MSNGDPSQNYPQPGQNPGVHGYAQAAPDPQQQGYQQPQYPQGPPPQQQTQQPPPGQMGPTWNPHTGQWEGGPPPQQQGPQPYWDGQQWVYPQPQGSPVNQPQPQIDQDLVDALDETKEELDQRTRDFGDFDFVKPKMPERVGDSTESVIRLLPKWPGKEQTQQPKGNFWKEYVHFVWVESQETPGKNVRQCVLCEREMTPPGYQPAPCPVCDRRDQAEREGDQKMAQSLQARPRFLFNAIDCEDLQRHWKQNKQTGAWTCTAGVVTVGPGLMRKLITIFHQRQNIADLRYGKNLVIITTKVGKAQRDVRYDALDQGEPGPVPQGFEAIQLVDLSQVTPRKDYNEVAVQLQKTYPTRQAAPQQGYQQGAPAQQSQPPYGNPYQGSQQPPQQAQQQFQGYQQGPPPQGYQQGPPPQGYQQGPPPQGYQPQQGPPQQGPPQGYQQGPPQQGPPQGYQQGPPQQGPPQGYQQGPPQQGPPQQGPPYGQVGGDDEPPF